MLMKNSINNKSIISGFVAFLLVFLIFQNGWSQDELTWISFEKALSEAEATNRPVLVNVWAPWCGWCRKLERDVYPEMAKELNRDFVLTRINRDDNKTEHRYRGIKMTSLELAKKLKSHSVPAIIFLDSKGDYLLDISGYLEAKELLPVLTYISSQSYKTQSSDSNSDYP